MSRTLRYSDEAVADLEAIRRWQTQTGSGVAAIRRLKAIRTMIRSLKQTPCRYPFGDHCEVRELPCEGHRVMYIVQSDTSRNETAGDVMVLRIFGPGQSRD